MNKNGLYATPQQQLNKFNQMTPDERLQE